MRRVAFSVIWALLTITGSLEALETDQYWAWNSEVVARIPDGGDEQFGLLYRVDSGDGRKWTVTGSVGWGF